MGVRVDMVWSETATFDGCTCTRLRFVFTSCCSFLNARAFNDWPVAVAGLSRALGVKKWLLVRA